MMDVCATVHEGGVVELTIGITDDDAPVRDDCGSPTIMWGDGDGSAQCELACVAAGNAPSDPSGIKRAEKHVYEAPGTYTITVTGESNCGEAPGGRATMSLEVTIEG
jgi:hypothetical protein